MINPELKEGDRVVCLQMEDEFSSVPPGTAGTVKKVSEVFGVIQYSVKWDNGSSLELLSDVDAWDLEDNVNKKRQRRKLTEQDDPTKFFMDNTELFKNFKMKFLKEYLISLAKCGVVNMFQSSPYLWMGRDRMELDFRYHNVENEICDEVLEKANEAQSIMINGVIKILEKEGKQVELDRINSYLRKYSTKIVMGYMYLLSA
jgi:hypothetical protein